MARNAERVNVLFFCFEPTTYVASSPGSLRVAREPGTFSHVI